MNMQRTMIAAAVAVGFAGAAAAQGLRPIESQGIALGSVAGDAYYTVQPDGFHVVATFASRDGSGTPVRLQAVLANGQGIVVSTPRSAGEAPVSVDIIRQNDHVLVNRTSATD